MPVLISRQDATETVDGKFTAAQEEAKTAKADDRSLPDA
jgi:hypothetical protein